MHDTLNFDIERLRASARANGDDAAIWRWYSDMMEDRRVRCDCLRDSWVIFVDGRECARDKSFDLAARRSYATCRAMASLDRVKK